MTYVKLRAHTKHHYPLYNSRVYHLLTKHATESSSKKFIGTAVKQEFISRLYDDVTLLDTTFSHALFFRFSIHEFTCTWYGCASVLFLHSINIASILFLMNVHFKQSPGIGKSTSLGLPSAKGSGGFHFFGYPVDPHAIYWDMSVSLDRKCPESNI